MDDVVRLVVDRYDGALKAEHGTGRNMAPFVETEWGPAAYAVMSASRTLADPAGLLNPGVLLNADPRAHLQDLKPLPSVEEEVDRCIECGFCEPLCPSRDLTLTPRQRIVVRRELARLDGTRSDPALRAALEADFPYEALDTCAVDGLCATACPVKIDTGQLTKRFRALRHPAAARGAAALVARFFGLLEPALRMGLRMGHAVQSLFGARAMTGVTRVVRAVSGGALPLWSAEMPRAAVKPRRETAGAAPQAVYFPSCISPDDGARGRRRHAAARRHDRRARARVPAFAVHVPPDAAGTCCGVPFSSKGYTAAHAFAANRAIANFWRWSDGGRLPVFVDTSPCTYGLLHARDVPHGREPGAFRRAHDPRRRRLRSRRAPAEARRDAEGAVGRPPPRVLAREDGPRPEARGRGARLRGDGHDPARRGLLRLRGRPRLPLPRAHGVGDARRGRGGHASAAAAGHWSSSRTCEAGLSRATGARYRSFVHLVERATRPLIP